MTRRPRRARARVQSLKSYMTPFWQLVAGRSGSGHAARLLRIWAWYERLDSALFPTQPIPRACDGFARVTFTRHRGLPFTLPDGTQVNQGDSICRLHLSSSSLRSLAGRNVWLLPPAIRSDLRALAAAVERGELPAFSAMYGRTVMAHLSPAFGFTIRRRRHSFRSFLDRLYLQGLLILYSRCGVEKLLAGRTALAWPDETWMSRGDLLRLYGSA